MTLDPVLYLNGLICVTRHGPRTGTSAVLTVTPHVHGVATQIDVPGADSEKLFALFDTETRSVYDLYPQLDTDRMRAIFVMGWVAHTMPSAAVAYSRGV